MKDGAFLYQLSDCKLFSVLSAACSWLFLSEYFTRNLLSVLGDIGLLCDLFNDVFLTA
jgi:hypothetical protein